jgi:chromosome partitioning protein
MKVAVLSPKGGCGKSTATLLMASMFSESGDLKVAVLDADPRQSIARVWNAKRGAGQGAHPPFTVGSDSNESTFLDTLEELSEKADITFIDLEGVNGLMATYAAAAADLCIVPMRPSILDSDAASQAIRMIRDAGRTSRREIKYKVLVSQTDPAIQTTSYREMVAELDDAKIPRFRTEMMRRAPFERMMTTGKTISEMEQTESVLKALQNARALAREVETELTK